MVDQPGAGNSNTYKIRAHTSRQRHTAKPYARPSERKKVSSALFCNLEWSKYVGMVEMLFFY